MMIISLAQVIHVSPHKDYQRFKIQLQYCIQHQIIRTGQNYEVVDPLEHFMRLTSAPSTGKSPRISRPPTVAANRCCCCITLFFAGCGYGALYISSFSSFPQSVMRITHCRASAGLFTPATTGEEVEALIAWRRADIGRPEGGAETRLLLVDTCGLVN